MNEMQTCPQCNNPSCDLEDDFCWNCGFELGNWCDNPACTAVVTPCNESGTFELPDDFTYCPHCGSKTRYGELGLAQEISFDP